MRSYIKTYSLFLPLFSCLYSWSQPTTQPLDRTKSFLGNTAQELVYDRAKIYLDEQTYDINGQQVIGSPFLYHNWNKGTILTADSRAFTNYQLKYNVFNQTIFFTDGRDSLEANDPVRQFSLMIPIDSGRTKQYTFIHCDFVRKEKSPFYYEVVVDSSQWQLLKVNRKVIAEPDNGLPVAAGKKVFQLEVEYFLYSKQTQKLAQVKANGANIAKLLGLSPEDEKAIGLRNFDFSREADIVSFLKVYEAYTQRPKRAF